MQNIIFFRNRIKKIGEGKIVRWLCLSSLVCNVLSKFFMFFYLTFQWTILCNNKIVSIISKEICSTIEIEQNSFNQVDQQLYGDSDFTKNGKQKDYSGATLLWFKTSYPCSHFSCGSWNSDLFWTKKSW